MSKMTPQTRQNRAKLSTIFDETKPTVPATETPTATGHVDRPERAGQTPMPFWVPIAAKRQLRIMAAEGDTTQQALMREALNMLFTKHGKPPIA
ncbi:MAG: hypothetical protein JZU63_13080 [Rhodoferax sp.]|jgi:hypothetical protein|nr:hypothetical protein [Rhodoferax sp.]